MNSKDEVTVPYIVHEGVMARMERTIKRLIFALIATVVLLFASNGLWLWYMSGFDIETYDYVQDGVGVNIIGSKNGVSYDVPDTDNQADDSQKESEKAVGAP